MNIKLLNQLLSGTTIHDIRLVNDTIKLYYSDLKTQVEIFDAGQTCCENRYITTDDELNYYKKALIKSIELVDRGSTEENKFMDHDLQFLRIHTDKGTIVFETHNIHNGYYGGFNIEGKIICK